MKRVIAVLLSIVIFAGCGRTVYESGMYADVRDWDFYTDAVAFCVNEGYMVPEGDTFGAYVPITLSECADIMAKIAGKGEKNPIKFVLDEGIAHHNYMEWDASASREDIAYMIAKIVEHEYINPVSDGIIVDVEESFAKEEIYALYRMGIFSGDKDTETFRPLESMTKAEMAIVVERVCNSEKRVKFDKSRMEATFVAFGDTIGHSPVLNAAKTETGYNFDPAFENVKKYIETADVACVNQETIFVPSAFSGYPAFGTPEEMGTAEVKAGFDVITHATNHAYDRGEGGIMYTTEFWKDYDVEVLGIHESAEDAEKISIINVNGIKIALLNYTYSLNGFRLPKNKDYLVDLLDEEKIKSDMAKARKLSDAIVVFAHWGNEYQNKPAQSQRQWAQLFANEGATVIVGHHPHVVQPLEIVTSFDGRVVPVYYSLGNFISNQNDYQNALCAMADFKIVKDGIGVRCEDYKIEGVVTHMTSRYYSAYLLEDYTEEMAKEHKHRGRYGTKFSVEAYKNVFENIVK